MSWTLRLLAFALYFALLPAPAVARDATRPLALADAVAAVGRWDMAARMYREATAARPMDAAAWAGLGRALLEGGAPVDALAALRKAEQLDSTRAGLQHLIGRAAVALGQPAVAETAFRRAAHDAPNDPRAWVGLGVALDLGRRHADAREAYARALSLDPLSVAARNNLALSRALAGDANAARAELALIADPRARANLAMLAAPAR